MAVFPVPSLLDGVMALHRELEKVLEAGPGKGALRLILSSHGLWAVYTTHRMIPFLPYNRVSHGVMTL